MTDYRGDIERMAEAFGLDPDLVEAVVLTESSGRTDAFRFEQGFYDRYLRDNPDYPRPHVPRRISSSYGLMQVMYPVARELGLSADADPEELFKPAWGLYYGCKKLAQLLAWADGDVERALAAYNGGKGSVGSQTTQFYVKKVLGALALIRQRGPFA